MSGSVHLDGELRYWERVLAGKDRLSLGRFPVPEPGHVAAWLAGRGVRVVGMLTPIEYELRHSKIEPVA
jgi:hypothetical protein